MGKHLGGIMKGEALVKQDIGKGAESLINSLFEITAMTLEETEKMASQGQPFMKAVEGAFESEMKRSSDLTAWPCPSFWEGSVYTDSPSNDALLINIASHMVPNCNDDDPFVRCTINRDKCEVKRDAKCK